MAKEMSIECLAVPAVSLLANSASVAHMIDLAQKYDHYARRFQAAMDDRNLTNEEMGARLDAHSVTVSKLRTGKIRMDDEWRARVAKALSIDEDVLFGEADLPVPALTDIHRPLRRRGRKSANDNSPLPVYGYAAGAIIGHRNPNAPSYETVPRPPGLFGVESAYALRTRSDSMVPRYLPEEILYVNPEQTPSSGDHVIIHVKHHDGDDAETWVKRYDGETKTEVCVTQYNPQATLTFKRKYVQFIHRVLPPNELFPPG